MFWVTCPLRPRERVRCIAWGVTFSCSFSFFLEEFSAFLLVRIRVRERNSHFPQLIVEILKMLSLLFHFSAIRQCTALWIPVSSPLKLCLSRSPVTSQVLNYTLECSGCEISLLSFAGIDSPECVGWARDPLPLLSPHISHCLSYKPCLIDLLCIVASYQTISYLTLAV